MNLYEYVIAYFKNEERPVILRNQCLVFAKDLEEAKMKEDIKIYVREFYEHTSLSYRLPYSNPYSNSIIVPENNISTLTNL